MTNADRWLLPEGIDEILPPQAQRLESIRRKLLDLYLSWGYEQVFPPLVEYLESLLVGAGNDLALQTFRLTDQLTGRQMGIRADMTPQVARIDAHTLNRDGPVRLCYAGQVLHSRPASLTEPRSLIQVGAELYGYDGIEADCEIVGLMLQTLQLAGCQDLHLDIGHVGIYRSLSVRAGLTPEQEYELFDIFQRKSMPELADFVTAQVDDLALRELFLRLGNLAGEATLIDVAKQHLAGLGAEIDHALQELDSLAAYVRSVFPSVRLYLDLGELRGYHYHTGSVFSVYVPGMGQAIANGGRYDQIGAAFGRQRPATGFSTDLAQLVRLMTADIGTPPERILAPADPDPSLQRLVAQLRSDGRCVVSALPGQALSQQARGCTHEISQTKTGWAVQPYTG